MKRLSVFFFLVTLSAIAEGKGKKSVATMVPGTGTKPIPHVTGIREMQCKFDLSTHDNKTVFNSLLFPVKADEAALGKGLQGMLGPFKVQIIFHSSRYGDAKNAQLLIDKLTLTMWEPNDDTNPVGITGAGEGDVPLDLATIVRTRHMVKLTNERKIVYYCFVGKG